MISIRSFSQPENDRINYWKVTAHKTSNWDFALEKQGSWTNWISNQSDPNPIVIAINTDRGTIGISNKGGVLLSLLSEEKNTEEVIEGKKCLCYYYKAIDRTGMAGEKCDVILRAFYDDTLHLVVSYNSIKIAYLASRIRD